MPLQTLLNGIQDCCINGTSHKDCGVKVSVQPKRDESVNFYLIDEGSCNFRGKLRVRVNEGVCDLLIHYENGATIVCLVELKGKDVSRALDQLIDTFDAIRRQLPSIVDHNSIWRACVRQAVSAPTKKTRSVLQKRKRLLRYMDDVKITKQRDISNFIRP